MVGYMPWDNSWHSQILYLPWVQPEIPGMEDSPVLPAYPVFMDLLTNGAYGQDFFTAVASTMVFLLGHEPEAAVNKQYCAWLRIFNAELANQLFYEGTEMTARYNFPQAVWMLQASLLLEPESYETNYNLALAFNHLATKLTREEQFRDAGDCYNQAQQYFHNASQLRREGYSDGAQADQEDRESDDWHDSGVHREW